MTVLKLGQPQHYRIGHPDTGWTACGLRGIQHRPLKYTGDPALVSCRKCRSWLRKQPASS